MLQFTWHNAVIMYYTIRDNFSGQKDVCSDGCIVFALLKSLRIETILSVTPKTQLEFGSALS